MACIEALYRRYYQNVFYYCFKIIGNREDALDASSDIFLKVIENLNFLQQAITFQAWLFRIARNQATNYYYQNQKNRCVSIEDISPPAQLDVPKKEHLAKDAKVEKRKIAFQALPADVQELLQKKYQDGKPIKSLMQQYQISKSAVKMRLARGRRKAKKQLAGMV